jgi:hypothetical protein
MILATGHKIDFQIGEIVYLITDVYQSERIVTRIQLMPNRGVLYNLSFSSTSEWYYNIEISKDKDQIKALG